MAERNEGPIAKAIKAGVDVSPSATELCVVSDTLPQLSQGNAGCVDLLFVLAFRHASPRPQV